MNISDSLKIMLAEQVFKRTPNGRPITDFAIETIKASMEDKKNYDQNIMECANCGLIVSSLLVESGCPNCGLRQKINSSIKGE